MIRWRLGKEDHQEDHQMLVLPSKAREDGLGLKANDGSYCGKLS